MSDEEMPDVPDMGDDMSDGCDDDQGYPSPSELPEGVKKEVIKEGDGWKKPKAGDEVTVHYVGTLEADASEFDSSRGREQPFTFALGRGQVIKGWDLGVATMKKGELARFTLAPEYGYGEAGSPPKIPGAASLVFEVELLSWLSKDDLFNDGGVVKTMIKEGTGWRKPSNGDEVRISLKCTARDGSIVEDKAGLDYTLGSEALGPLSKAVDKALAGMKKSEEAELACMREYACGDRTPDGATVGLTLEHMYEAKDVSFAKDKSMIKKQIVDGETYDTPKDAAKVKLFVEAATTLTGEPLKGFAPKTLEFTVGNGEVCDALECAVSEMKRGEKAVLTCTMPKLCIEEKVGLERISADGAVLTLELVSYEKAQETWNMSEDEKVEFGAARKEVGSSLFRQGRYHLALGRYRKVTEMFGYVDNFKEENKTKARDMKKACDLNSAACQLKLKEYAEAKKECEKVLKEESANVKALFRRAQANFGLKNFMDCLVDLKKIIARDPQNREARTLLKEAQAAQKEEDKKSKGLFAKMCQGLGRSPVPTPSQDRKLVPESNNEGAAAKAACEERSDAKDVATKAASEPMQDAPRGEEGAHGEADEPMPATEA
eukprot:CAMPEP_0179088380 /NCGR_PEP_ID=MMETSP0796-20121207/40210_1 /TAXON_ID=73915 /ORGANISM="Pyrodinium bahamense, Strain pbaha01" /LENGTH=602 /DNA_ID=CAMNT_0020785909 /DNA_START=54 /DNA_END=1862 /DNA_ORIENTATION=+